MGNHDAVACGLSDPVDFNPIARAAVLWTREALSADNLEYLQSQPEQRSPDEGVRLVHGSLLHRDNYLLSRYDIMENVIRMRMEQPGLRILFFGHTHTQVAFSCDNENNISMVSSPRFSLRDDRVYLINPGSVGQPRDQDPRCSFLVYDDESSTVEFIRLSYDIKACAQKILSQGLPRELADRLYQGW
jgi:diadenosine tetraphosphatase ApaH/serine/threonine PP2A family protein phosphatase